MTLRMSFVIAILGDAPFGQALDEIATRKTIAGRKIVLRRFASLSDYRPPSHILFISRSLSPEHQASAARQVQMAGVLLVGETPGFAETGGAINFLH